MTHQGNGACQDGRQEESALTGTAVNAVGIGTDRDATAEHVRWAGRIHAVWRQGVAAIIETGRLIATAKLPAAWRVRGDGRARPEVQFARHGHPRPRPTVPTPSSKYRGDDVIERMHPGVPKIELFSRSPREGWAAWGNECE